MGNRPISVAVTPDGFADAVTRDENGKSWFVEPCVEKMTMGAFLGKLRDRECSFYACCLVSGKMVATLQLLIKCGAPQCASSTSFHCLFSLVRRYIFMQ